MKRELITAVLIAVLIALVGAKPSVRAEESSALVYKAALVDLLGSGADVGEVMVWDNAKMKIRLAFEGVPAGKTYYVTIDSGPTWDRTTNFLGSMTTDKNGRAIEFFDLVELLLDPSLPFERWIINPGIVIWPGEGGQGIAVTAFSINSAPSIKCRKTKGAEYIISGGPDVTDGIFVDDFLDIYLNGVQISHIHQMGGCCPPAEPVHFFADSLDILQVVATDANDCYSLGSLYLQKSDGSCLMQLTGEISGPNCGSEPFGQIFFDETFILP